MPTPSRTGCGPACPTTSRPGPPRTGWGWARPACTSPPCRPGWPAAGTPGSGPYLRGATADGPALTGWDVRQRHADPVPDRLRAGLLNDLETGAASVWLVLGEAGLPVADLPAALDGVYVDLAPIALDAGAQAAEAAAAYLRLVGERGLDPA